MHPQTWPDDLDTTKKKVVVIDSGATAATLIPNMADKCAHVTVLHRSPTWFRTGRTAIEIAEGLRKLQIDEAWIHEIVRNKFFASSRSFTKRIFAEPDAVKRDLLAAVTGYLSEDYDIATHFTPKYRPSRQRIAFIPDGYLLRPNRHCKASVVTDEIERFVAGGIMLKSGRVLEANVIVTAIGFHLSTTGGIAFDIDGKLVDFADTVTYRGMMFTGVPNLFWVFGYFRASWTFRVDLVGDFVCWLFGHMQSTGKKQVRPVQRAQDSNMPLLPRIDEQDFNPGYITRGMHVLPKRGDKPEWQHTQDYWCEKDWFPAIDLNAGEFRYR